MGTDIHPTIEIERQSGLWESLPVNRDGSLRNYAVFGVLFGVCAPRLGLENGLFGLRGLPAHCSARTRAASLCAAWHSHSWVGAAELAAIDWSRFDYDVVALEWRWREQQCQLTFEYPVAELASGRAALLRAGGSTNITEDVTEYALDWRRKSILCEEWRFLLAQVASQAREWGPDHVRLVVWFDN